MPTSSSIITQLIETPQSLSDDDFSLSLDQHNEGVASHLSTGRKQVATVLGVPVYLSENPRTNLATYFTTENDRADHQMTFLITVSDEKAVPLGLVSIQMALWRGPFAPDRLPGQVFWSVVFPRNKAVVSFSGPNRTGSQFWGDRLHEAIRDG